MKRILVLCTGNSCRSQIAEGYLRKYSGNKAEIYSAGIQTHGVNPRAIRVMKEDGIDISNHTSNNVIEYLHINFDFVISVCDHAKEHCPVFPAVVKKVHHNFPDPSKGTGSDEQIMKQFREVRDLIRAFCMDFVANYL
jgi:arsenate reductase